MLEHGKINRRQAIFLGITLLTPSAMIYAPAITAGAARQDAWLSTIAATLAGLLITWLVISLVLRFPGKNLFEIPELILGKVAGKIIAVLYVLWFIHFEILLFAEFGNFMITTILPGTPVVVIHILSTLVIAYIARNGLEVLSRLNELFLPFFITAFAIFIALAAKDMVTARLLPVLDVEPVSILKGTAFTLTWIGQIIGLAVIAPYLNKPGQTMRAAVLATLASGLLITLNVLYALLLLGPDLTSIYSYPVYTAVRTISLANFLERLEVVPVTIWIVAGMIEDSFFRYAASLGAAQTLGLKDYRPLVLPFGAFVVAAALLIYQDVSVIDAFKTKIWPYYSLLFEAGIPFLLFIAAVIRGVGEKQRHQAENDTKY